MTYDTVFISDVHLGTNRCDVETFLKFIKNIKTKKLVLVGDIIDIACMEKYGTRWKSDHTECVHQILNLAKKEQKLFMFLEIMKDKYVDIVISNIKIFKW